MKESDLLNKWNRLNLGRISAKEFVDFMHQHKDIVNLEGWLEMAVKDVSNESEPDSEHSVEEYFLQKIVNTLGEDVPMLNQKEEEEIYPQEIDNRLVKDIPMSNRREEEELFPPVIDNPLGENVPLLFSDWIWRQLLFNS